MSEESVALFPGENFSSFYFFLRNCEMLYLKELGFDENSKIGVLETSNLGTFIEPLKILNELPGAQVHVMTNGKHSQKFYASLILGKKIKIEVFSEIDCNRLPNGKKMPNYDLVSKFPKKRETKFINFETGVEEAKQLSDQKFVNGLYTKEVKQYFIKLSEANIQNLQNNFTVDYFQGRIINELVPSLENLIEKDQKDNQEHNQGFNSYIVGTTFWNIKKAINSEKNEKTKLYLQQVYSKALSLIFNKLLTNKGLYVEETTPAHIYGNGRVSELLDASKNKGFSLDALVPLSLLTAQERLLGDIRIHMTGKEANNEHLNKIRKDITKVLNVLNTKKVIYKLKTVDESALTQEFENKEKTVVSLIKNEKGNYNIWTVETKELKEKLPNTHRIRFKPKILS